MLVYLCGRIIYVCVTIHSIHSYTSCSYICDSVCHARMHTHVQLKLYIVAEKVNSDEVVDYGHSSELKVTPVDHRLPTTHAEKDINSHNAKLKATPIKPLSLADPLRANSDDDAVHSNVSSSEC